MSVDTADSAINADFTLGELDGRWRSPFAAEVFPGIFGIDDFWLHSPFWAIHFNSYGDPECEHRLFELIITGMFEMLGPNPAVAGSRDLNFSRTKVCLRLFEPALIEGADGVNAGNGHWVAGEWQDVSLGGCAPLDLPGVDECPLEYDLLGLARSGERDGVGDRLYFGQRHHDELGSIWTRRAPGLLDYYVNRVVGTPPAVGHGAEWGPAEWTRITSSHTPQR
ncbi:hypothetical protein [Streptosporangium subroseum]|uniref:hypothetical protein n=1 Tax=Streptosporangium subroseum TaxID=106412 RepID=UPI003090ABA3|nr:hypothetical protein OHB15_19135 [Streptosporangium subroseum]